jgi:hypothetical protein
MGFLVSPGVEVKEIDLTNVIPALSTSIGGFAGRFKWGPAGSLQTVSSENDLAEIFGKPDASTCRLFLQAAGFLKYGNTLKISRAVKALSGGASIVEADTISATTGNGGSAMASNVNLVQVKDLAQFEQDASTLAGTTITAIARCPGAYGNSLQIVIARTSTSYAASTDTLASADVGKTQDAKIKVRDNFDAAPGAANTTSGAAGANDEIHVLVVDQDGQLTGIKNNVIEKYQGLSLCSDAKNEDGSTNYYYDVINNSSQFIFINKLDTIYTNADKTIAEVDGGSTDIANVTAVEDNSTIASGVFGDGIYMESFTSGQDGTIDAASVNAALELFSDAETVDVNLLFAEAGGLADSDQDTVDENLCTIASTRKDVVAFISPPVGVNAEAIEKKTSENAKRDAVIAKRNALSGSSSYSFMDSSPLYVYNKYDDNYVYIAASGHMAGLCVNTDNVAESWFSPAGYNRGNLRGITKLAFNPNQSSRDTLYKSQVNPIVSFPGQGILLFGDKTGQVKASAFDRINVRRLFITLEKAIATASKFQLFELNDEFTRAQFRNLVEPFLRDVKGRRGITDFLVVCDETNNTGQVIDTNRFVADIYIKPARSINFITLNFVATRTGVDFSEVTS